MNHTPQPIIRVHHLTEQTCFSYNYIAQQDQNTTPDKIVFLLSSFAKSKPTTNNQNFIQSDQAAIKQCANLTLVLQNGKITYKRET